MEEEEQAMSSPPFWLQNGSAGRRHLRRSYSLFVSSGTLFIFLLVIALAFILVLIPTLHSFTSQVFKPQSVKKSWDSLNLVLVLFAIICGFLSRNNNNTSNNETPRSFENQSLSDTKLPQSHPWYTEFPDRTPYYRLRSFNSYPDLRQESSWGNDRLRFSDDTIVTGYRGLELDASKKEQVEEEKQSTAEQSVKTEQSMRSFNSYPDLRQESSWGNERLRFHDDTRVNGYRGLELDAAKKEEVVEEEKQSKTEQSIKNIEVDTFEARSNVGRNYKEKTVEKPKSNRDFGSDSEKLLKAREKKKKGASATKELLASLKGKKKKQRSRSVENFQSILNSEPPPLLPSDPPPPPPLPPSSDFHNLFYSKKRKHKKPHSATPPTPPPPPSRQFSSKLVSKTKPLDQGVATLKPRVSKTKKEDNLYALAENVLIGNESPLNSIPPPPPPPPPFKMPMWKFRKQGDFVRIDSMINGSPDSDEVVDSPSGEDGEIPLFYASPNVDSKADNFIERFRAGLKMERVNSTKEKQGIGRSNLFPGLS